MLNNVIALNLESEATRLEMITQTFLSLDMAMSDGASIIKPNAFSLPCEDLERICNNIVGLVNKLCENGKEKTA